MSDEALARRAIALLDLTDLAEDASAAGLDALCARALLPPIPVAAVCVWPRFVARARTRLAGTRVRIATVVNFPAGNGLVATVVVRRRDRGARPMAPNEIDLVMPLKSLSRRRERRAARNRDDRGRG